MRHSGDVGRLLDFRDKFFLPKHSRAHQAAAGSSPENSIERLRRSGKVFSGTIVLIVHLESLFMNCVQILGSTCRHKSVIFIWQEAAHGDLSAETLNSASAAYDGLRKGADDSTRIIVPASAQWPPLKRGATFHSDLLAIC